MKEKKLSKIQKEQLLIKGCFFEIKWFNPFYLDKTGEAMAKSRSRLMRWGTTDRESIYFDKNGFHEGQLSIDKYWLKLVNPKSYSLEIFEKFRKQVVDDLSDFVPIYNIQEIYRIGFRIQGIYTVFEQKHLDIFNSLIPEKFRIFGEYFDLENKNPFIVLTEKNKDLKINLQLGVSMKKAANGETSPSGLSIDADYFKDFVNFRSVKFIDVEKQLVLFFKSFLKNYETLLINSLTIFGFPSDK